MRRLDHARVFPVPDVVRGGQAGFRVRRPGEREDPRLEIEQLRDVVADLTRRIASIEGLPGTKQQTSREGMS